MSIFISHSNWTHLQLLGWGLAEANDSNPNSFDGNRFRNPGFSQLAMACFGPFIFVLSWSNRLKEKPLLQGYRDVFPCLLLLVMGKAGCQYYLQPTSDQVGSRLWNEANKVVLRAKKQKEPTSQLTWLRSWTNQFHYQTSHFLYNDFISCLISLSQALFRAQIMWDNTMKERTRLFWRSARAERIISHFYEQILGNFKDY